MALSISKAFSLIEIVFGIVILGILVSVAIPRLSSDSKICELALSSKLGILQSKISLLFTKAHLSDQKINRSEIFALLGALDKDGTNECFLRFNPQNLTILAKSHSQATILRISPKDFSSNPKIFCELSNPLCKKINYKTKKK
ncbi:hypothetical protein BKH41_02565 [Helicobacter sp. 12S02232-10]|uniref:prepilin-type N-terminal cleavage/methylation domain-containing protein n=1 Tax=Helicobacter sp. 12S02232-10 TaxID=1476197 RepID=UPI000BA5C369|nr:prepilin-type N-terminal cleavage/methylation domain-containing protein [Helicobacter sp. 12S02232-10]PAF49566.1 hypothetical protein BKH41_02565 [Helicobacter sp. 12S02232-10]